jgi:DNA-binding beta-propeller fold protein YncE
MKLRHNIFFIALLISLLLQISPLSFAESAELQKPYSIQTKWSLSGGGGWGALLTDASSGLLYVPRTNRIAVMDTETGKKVGEIQGVVDARAIALDANGKYGYVTDVTDGRAGFVRVFDQTTRQIITSIPAGKNPDAIILEPTTNTILAFSRHDRSATLIDTKSNQVVSTIRLTGLPSSAVADGRGNVFVTIQDKGQLVRIDGKAARSTAAWTLSGCQGPTGLAIDSHERRLFALCENSKLVVVSESNGAHLATVPTGAGPGTVAFDLQLQSIFVADGAGELTVIERRGATQYVAQQTLNILPGSHVLAIDAAKDRAYLIAAEYSQRTDDVSEELRLRPTPAAGKCSVVVVGR